MTYEAVVRNETQNGRDICRFGIANNSAFTGGSYQDGIWFQSDSAVDGNWHGHTVNSSTTTDINSSTAVDGNFHHFKFVLNAAANSCEFFYDGVSFGTSTTNINTGTTLRPFFTNIISGAGDRDGRLYVDAVLINYEVNRV